MMKRYCLTALLALTVPAATMHAFAQMEGAKPQGAKPATTKPAPGKPTAGGRVVELTGGDDMKFSVTEIAAKRGETIRIQLKNVGTLPKIAMAHNVVVVKPTTKLADFTMAAQMARDTNYVPAAMKAEVLAATALAGPGETVDVSFKVPAVAGDYPFLCSFPGHFAAGMKGTLVVK